MHMASLGRLLRLVLSFRVFWAEGLEERGPFGVVTRWEWRGEVLWITYDGEKKNFKIWQIKFRFMAKIYENHVD